ncbi:MAG: tetratricopeptide repeat protein, partial [Candidatus Eisenbacteria bacterium]|nr:tetratricopeptide repeat protein [Candidatus Eisenbacteria bacterium]
LEEAGFRARLRSRLALFVQICDAIHYAHQRGVIHRDLKPANILIVGETEGDAASATPGVSRTARAGPQVKILDFGLARIVDPEAGTATASTEVGRIQGSLPYMSPEQARGATDAIDVRTDVYSLGVIFYELLTDRRPYETEGLLIHEAVRVIWEEPPRRPSGTWRQLRGDLETIVLKALEKDPDRRYQSVHALAEDVERYLANQPILARPASAAYQMRKVIARHQGAFAFAVTLAILLVGFAATMSVMFEQQRRARLRADLETRKAVRINEFLQEMLSSVDPEKARGREVTVRELLDQAAAEVESGLADQREVQAAVRTTLGLTYMALGSYTAAEPQLITALAANEAILGPRSPEVAGSLIDLGALRWKSGAYKEAETLWQRALAIQSETIGLENEIAATSLHNLSALYKTQGRYAEAESLGRESLIIRRRVLGAEHPDVAISLA